MKHQVGSPVLIADMISGAELRGYVEERLSIKKRQANASVSSWSAEGWMDRDAKGRPACITTSADARCAVQIDSRCEAPINNGKLGGRPRRGT